MRKFVKSFRSKDKPQPSAEPPTPAGVAPAHGLHVLAEGTDPIVDIVAVHGLNGHPERTWTADNGVHWLRTLLPQDIPNARILTWGYDANTHSKTGVSCQYLYDHARALVSDLCLERELTQTSKRPIIFIAHSLGGIVVKSALMHSDAARQGALVAHRSIKVSTYGILFMGTPHQGGNGVSLGMLLVNIASVFVPADDRLLQHLQRDSEWLQQQLGQYGPVSGEFVTKFAYEVYETPTALGRSLMIVPRASAVVPGAADAEPIAINADHRNMVKFSSRQDPEYRKIYGHMQLMAARAGDVVARRWEAEGRVDAARLGEISAPTCHVIPFPQNRKFVGREEQLLALQNKLFTQKDSQRVALVGLGGVGKTQVALQFAYWTKEHEPEYSVFWIPALSAESFDQACAELVRRLSIAKAADDEDPKESVRRYLDSERAGKWLLVVDNADNMDMLNDLLSGFGGISEFFPAHKNRLVLFTTRHEEAGWSLAGNDMVEVQQMSMPEARGLLEKYSRGKSILKDDAATTALIEELSFHPLALTQAAAYLTTKNVSIPKYVQLLRGTEQDLVSLISREFNDNTRYQSSQNAVATTWLVSFDQIRTAETHAADLLRFMS